jgi:hypothetical protein
MALRELGASRCPSRVAPFIMGAELFSAWEGKASKRTISIRRPGRISGYLAPVRTVVTGFTMEAPNQSKSMMTREPNTGLPYGVKARHPECSELDRYVGLGMYIDPSGRGVFPRLETNVDTAWWRRGGPSVGCANVTGPGCFRFAPLAASKVGFPPLPPAFRLFDIVNLMRCSASGGRRRSPATPLVLRCGSMPVANPASSSLSTAPNLVHPNRRKSREDAPRSYTFENRFPLGVT